MSSRKIVLIGAGSMVFSKGLLMDVVLTPQLSGSTVVLVDTNPEKLDLITRLAERLVQQQGVSISIEATTDRRQALPAADYVITTISVGGQAAWETDLRIPSKYGIVQPVGDTWGPGGLSRALRHIPVILAIARDMEALCPRAILFNYSNPNTAICRAVARETGIRVVGLCHGVRNTERFLADYMGVPLRELEVRAAGINHLVWMVQILHGGRDAYPKLRAALAEKGPGARPASFELMRIYGLFPGPGHDHIAEAYPFFTSARADLGRHYGLHTMSLAEMNEAREQRLGRFRAWADGSEPIPVEPSGEDVMEIITALITHQGKVCAVNVPNRGAIAGLQDWGVVEVSALVDGAGIQPLHTAELPRGILTTLRARIDQIELVVDAAVHCDRAAALQALLAESAVGSVADAEAMLEELLQAHASYLPGGF